MPENNDNPARVSHLRQGFSLNEWQIEPLAGCFKRDGNVVHVEPKVMDVLICLATTQGEVVTREKLLNSVWAGLVVGEEVLTRAISELRTLLGDTARERRYIRTVPKRGYALIALVGKLNSVKNDLSQAQVELASPKHSEHKLSDADNTSQPPSKKTTNILVALFRSISGFISSTLSAFKRVLLVFLGFILILILYSIVSGDGPKIEANFEDDDLKSIRFSQTEPTVDIISAAEGNDEYSDLLFPNVTPLLSQQNELPDTSSTHIPTLAVMPFTKLSKGSDQNFLAEGLSEDIRNELIKLHDIKVVARTSSQAFKERALDVREIGKQLSVELLLEGTVRLQDNRARITVQLTDTKTGFPQWSNAYNTPIDDVFSVQRDISQDIVQQIAPQLASKLQKKPVKNQQAHMQYLMGRHFWHQRTPESLAIALEKFKQAIAFDPNSALSYSGISDTYMLSIGYAKMPLKKALPLAKKNVRKALELEPQLAEAHASLGLIYERERKLELARKSYQLSVALNPSNSMARMWYGNTLLELSEASAAFDQFQRALELDPLHPTIQQNFLGALSIMGRYKEASELSNQMYQISKAEKVLKPMLEAMSQSGRYHELLQFVARQNFPEEQKPILLYQISEALIQLQLFDRAKTILDTNFEDKHDTLELEAGHALGLRDSKNLRRLANDLTRYKKMKPTWFVCAKARREYWMGISSFMDKDFSAATSKFNEARDMGFLTCHFDADRRISLLIYLSESQYLANNTKEARETLSEAKDMLSLALQRGWAKTSLRGSQIALYLMEENYTELETLVNILLAAEVQPWSNLLSHPLFDRYLKKPEAMAVLQPIKNQFEEDRKKSLEIPLMKYGI